MGKNVGKIDAPADDGSQVGVAAGNSTVFPSAERPRGLTVQGRRVPRDALRHTGGEPGTTKSPRHHLVAHPFRAVRVVVAGGASPPARGRLPMQAWIRSVRYADEGEGAVRRRSAAPSYPTGISLEERLPLSPRCAGRPFEAKCRSESAHTAMQEIKAGQRATRSGRAPGRPIRATPEKVAAILAYGARGLTWERWRTELGSQGRLRQYCISGAPGAVTQPPRHERVRWSTGGAGGLT